MITGSTIISTNVYSLISGKDGSKVTTVVATPGQGSERPQEVSYTDTKVSFCSYKTERFCNLVIADPINTSFYI